LNSIINALLKSSAPILMLLGVPLSTVHAAMPAKNVSPVVATHRDLGSAEAGKEMKVLVELRMNDTDAFEKKLASLFDPASADYHNWLSKEDLDTFAPLPESAATVSTANFRKSPLGDSETAMRAPSGDQAGPLLEK